MSKKLSECEKGYRRWISPKNHAPDLKEYIREQARVSDLNSKEWEKAGNAIQSAYRNGMWYAYHDVENRLGDYSALEAKVKVLWDALRECIERLEDEAGRTGSLSHIERWEKVISETGGEK